MRKQGKYLWLMWSNHLKVDLQPMESFNSLLLRFFSILAPTTTHILF